MTDQALPTHFHIGTQKAGSTFLYNLLASHPSVSLSSQTEVHYYSKYFERGEGWYLSLFAQPGVKIDTSPKYFMNGEVVAPRIKAACGDEARLLLVVRNPIDLINSHFQMHVVSGHFKKHPDRYPTIPKSVVACVELYPDYLKQAKYFSELQTHWLAQFKKEQIKVVIFEHFIKNVDEVMDEVLDFFALPPAKLSAGKASQNKMLRNRWLFEARSRIVRYGWLKERLKQSQLFGYLYEHYLTRNSREAISADERKVLVALLKQEVVQLESFLGVTITEWSDFH